MWAELWKHKVSFPKDRSCQLLGFCVLFCQMGCDRTHLQKVGDENGVKAPGTKMGSEG